MGKKKTKIDLNRLDYELRNMTRHDPIYRVTRDALKFRGNWKQKARWHPTGLNIKKG